jgi:WD40 repeat protein
VSGFYTLELDGALRFFMEFVRGGNLAERLRTSHRLALPEVLDLGIQLASGMEYVHARGMVHRDLKPANCLVMQDRTLRITDFGLGKLAIRSDERVEPEQGISDRVHGEWSVAGAGTPAYMAPEQWRSLGDAGAPADIYAIGVTLFELLSGGHVFGLSRDGWQRYLGRLPSMLDNLVRGESPVPELVLRLFHEQVAPLPCRELGIDAPTDLDAVIAACLAKAPEARPTATQLRQQLVACHTRHVGGYPRELPSSLTPSQIGENNRAVSYFVMGETETATKILDSILQTEPTALFPWINRAQLGLAARTLEPTTVAERLANVVLVAHPGMERDRDVAAFASTIAPYHVSHPAPVIALATHGARCASLDATGVIRRLDHAMSVGQFPEATGVAFVPSGLAVAWMSTLALLHDDGTRHDLAAGGYLTALAARDGVLVTGDAEGRVTIWERDVPRVLRGPGLVRQIALCPTTDLVAAASADGGLVVWNGRGERVFEDPTGSLACHVNGAWGIVVQGCTDGSIHVWELGSRRQVVAMLGHERAVSGVGFLVDGTLVSASGDGSLRSWDARAGRLQQTLRLHHGPIRTLVIDRDIALTGGDDHAVRRTALRLPPPTPQLIVRKDISALERKQRLDERDRLIAQLRASRLDAFAAATALRQRAADLARDPVLREAEHVGAAAIGIPIGVRSAYAEWSRVLPWPATRLALHPSGGGLAVAGDLGESSELQLWDRHGKLRASARMPRALAMTWTRDGRALAVACLDNQVRRFQAPDLVLAWTGKWSSRGGMRALAQGPGEELVGAGWSRSVMRTSLQSNGTLRVWAGGTDSQELDRRGDEIYALATTADGARLAGAREAGAISIWDLHTRKRIGADLAHGGDIAALAFSRDGRALAAASRDGRWASWLPGQAARVSSNRHGTGVTSVQYTSGDRHVVTAGLDGAVRVWDAATGSELGAFRGHAGSLIADVVPGGREIASAGEDRVLHLWSVELEWLLGDAALEDALAALAGGTSRAWGAHAGALESHRVLDIWRDVERAALLATTSPQRWEAVRLAAQRSARHQT